MSVWNQDRDFTFLKYSTATDDVLFFETFSLEAVLKVTLASHPMYLYQKALMLLDGMGWVRLWVLVNL